MLTVESYLRKGFSAAISFCGVVAFVILSGSSAFASTQTGLQFVPVTPCRIADTRMPSPGNPIAAGTSRDFPVAGLCNIPATGAIAYSMNVTVVPNESLGFLSIYPTGDPAGTATSLMNSFDGRVKANAAIVSAGTGSDVTVFVSGNSNVVLDVNGYFTSDTSSPSTELQFYPLTPCRVADTRKTTFPTGLGAPSLGAQETRSLPILTSTCGIPSAAQAYSLNFTVVPQAPLGFLAAWPSDVARPTSSILNSYSGTVVANAAIVPGSKKDGSIDVYASAATDVIIDINGYFAPASSGPNGLGLYTVTPCRLVDTRKNIGAVGPIGGLPATVLDVSGTTACGTFPSSAAYLTNATAIPVAGTLGFMSLSPDGTTQPPSISTTNSYDGSVVSNMAIVPSTNGKIDAFASSPIQLLLDISGYFAVPAVTVSITPSGPVVLSAGQNLVFEATVANTPDTAVTWSLKEGSSCGFITPLSQNPLQANYVTPASVASPLTCTVQAQSNAYLSATASATVTVANVQPPVFTTAPPTTAQEGQQYSYTVAATDPNSGTVSFSLGSHPAGATLTGNVLTWTPTHAQSRVANHFTILATTSEGGGASQNWTVTPTGNIDGTVIDTYVTQAGNEPVAVDLSQSVITAYIPDGRGGYTPVAGTVTGSGTFSIEGVPTGWYVISWQTPGNPTYYVWTNASNVDFGQGHLGRPNTVTPANPVTVNFTMRLIAANSLKDEQYQWYSPDVNLLDTFEGTISGNPPIFTASQQELGGLIEGTTYNDQAFLTRAIQKPPTIDITNQAVVVTEYFGPDTSIDEVDGGTVNVGTSTSPAQMLSATRGTVTELNLAGGQFHNQLRAATVTPPPANSAETTIYTIEAQPYSAAQGQVGLVPSLLRYPFDARVPYLSSDEDHGSISFSSTMFPSWPVLYDYTQQYALPFNIPSASGKVFGPISQVRTVTATPPTTASLLAPMIGAVASPTINGATFFNTSTVNSTLNPVIAWSPSSLGTATAYRLQIYYVNPTGGEGGTGSLDEQYDFVFPASLFPQGSLSFTIPNGLLTSGDTYVFTITALDNPEAPSVTVSPFRKALPYGFVTSVSGEVKVQ